MLLYNGEILYNDDMFLYNDEILVGLLSHRNSLRFDAEGFLPAELLHCFQIIVHYAVLSKLTSIAMNVV